MLKGAMCIWGIEKYMIFLSEMVTCESNLKETNSPWVSGGR